jgi:hypothetical protein
MITSSMSVGGFLDSRGKSEREPNDLHQCSGFPNRSSCTFQGNPKLSSDLRAYHSPLMYWRTRFKSSIRPQGNTTGSIFNTGVAGQSGDSHSLIVTSSRERPYDDLQIPITNAVVDIGSCGRGISKGEVIMPSERVADPGFLFRSEGYESLVIMVRVCLGSLRFNIQRVTVQRDGWGATCNQRSTVLALWR